MEGYSIQDVEDWLSGMIAEYPFHESNFPLVDAAYTTTTVDLDRLKRRIETLIRQTTAATAATNDLSRMNAAYKQATRH